MKKRGQVTLYVILGILIILILAGILAVNQYIIKTDFEREKEKITVTTEFIPVKNYLDSCIQAVALEGATTLGLQGGYLNIPADELPVNPILPFSNRLQVFNNDALEVPYWFYETANGIQKGQVPSINEMEKDLQDYINLNINNCLNNFTAFEGYEFTNFENVKSEVNIDDEKIFIEVDTDFETSRKGLTTKFDKFLVSLDVPLGGLYKIALDIQEKENRDNFFEEKTIDMMVLYDEIPFSKTEFTCDIKIWDENQVKRDFKKIVNKNIGAIKLSTNPANIDYFTLSSINENINTNFLYSENWPFYMQVFPSENGILKGDDIIKKSGALRAISAFFCLNNYHFVYDIKYPILITLNKEGYTFQFANMVIIDNNQPRKNLLGTLEPLEGFDICDKKLTKTQVATFTISEDNQLIPLDDVDISYKCFTNTCNIGKTSSDETGNALVEDNFPQCINGQIIAEKNDYNKATSIISTNKESQVALILEHYYNEELEVKVIDKTSGAIRNLNEDEQVLLKFEAQDNDYSITINYPETKNINLIAGSYKITTHLIKKSDSGIKIDADTIQKCVRVPKGGLLGLFFEETKCVATTLEEFVVNEVVIGGAKFNYNIDISNLVSSNKIIIYTIFDKIPANNEEINNIYESVDTNAQTQKFKYPELIK